MSGATIPTSSGALRAAAHRALIADGALCAILGGPKIYDTRPRAVAFPYVTLGEQQSGEGTEEPSLTLHAWSRQGGHREAHAIAGALLGALDDLPLMPEPDREISLRFSLADIRREAGRVYHTVVQFRAIAPG